MKRVFSFALVLLAIVAGAASAQTPSIESKLFTKVSVEFSDASVPDTIRALCSEHSLKCWIDTNVRGTWSGTLKDVTLLEVLRTIATSRGYALELQGDSLVVRIPQNNQADARQAQMDEIRNRYPQAYNPDGTAGDFEQINQMNRELFELQQSSVPRPMPRPAAAYAAYYGDRPAPAFNYGYTGQVSPAYGGFGYDYLNPFAIRDFANTEKYGRLKIDGPDRFLQSVRVVIDGYDASVASKSNNAWNDPVYLTAGPHTIEFVRETDKRPILAFQRRVNIIPMSVQRDPTQLRVSGNEFENAREVYEYRQHRFVEQADGQTTQQPPAPTTPPKK